MARIRFKHGASTKEHTDEVVDEFGRYRLVSRLYKGAYRGAIWYDGKKLAEVVGDNIADVSSKLKDSLDSMLLERAKSRGVTQVSAKETVEAFRSFHKQLTEGHLAMLRAHYRAPHRRITATQLAQAAGYEGYWAANLQYGRVGLMLFAELPMNLPRRGSDGKLIYTCALAQGTGDQDDDEQWVWEMRPNVAQALEVLGIVS